MGDMKEIFEAMDEEKKKRKDKLEPMRMEYSIKRITGLGYEIISKDYSQIQFIFNGSPVTLFPYTGWFTGKTVTDGRGINNLIEQITPKKG